MGSGSSVSRTVDPGAVAKLDGVEAPASPLLSDSQLSTLAERREERTAKVGDVLYRVGDQSYPLIAILECRRAQRLERLGASS
jgi:hypothetical protein